MYAKLLVLTITLVTCSSDARETAVTSDDQINCGACKGLFDEIDYLVSKGEATQQRAHFFTQLFFFLQNGIFMYYFEVAPIDPYCGPLHCIDALMETKCPTMLRLTLDRNVNGVS